MLFSSLEFLLYFLPIVLLMYFLLHTNITLANTWLLIASLFFYAWGEPVFVLVMLSSIIFNYIMALAIDGVKALSVRRGLLIVDIALNVGILFVYKYLGFTLRSLCAAIPFLSGFLPDVHIALPIGISFFTFQAMSYVIDVYRGIPVQKNPLYVALYISFFPQLIAGPIVRYTTVMEQIEHRTVTINGFTQGMMRFARGFNKKVLLSNVLAQVADAAFGAEQLSTGMAWLGALAYTLQIFFDFSGYSDMAIGLGKMFGFDFLENFDYPYVSKTITEFWRRWHISLGSWFRDYVYFPLGGSRVDKRSTLIRNLLVVWFLTGLWHGANWTFILWGALYGVIIVCEKLLNIPKRMDNFVFPVRWAYRVFTMLMVILGWVIFNSADLSQAFSYIKTMFCGAELLDSAFFYNLYEYRFYLAAGCLISTPLFRELRRLVTGWGRFSSACCETVSCLTQITLFVYGVSCLVMNAHNPFIYFNF